MEAESTVSSLSLEEGRVREEVLFWGLNDFVSGFVVFINILPVSVEVWVDNSDSEICGVGVRHFLIIYIPRLKRMAEAETQEGEEEMEFAPRIDVEDTEEFDEDFREEYKSFDEVENSWQSILKVGGQAAVGMTSNAGFTPAVHNITYGGCGCKKKKSNCGCDD